MVKGIRNTCFTLIAVGLTAIGLSWNRPSVQGLQPLINQSVVAADHQTTLDVSIPLTITLARPVVKVGQYQTVTIQTVPNANLEIDTIYPNSSLNDPQIIRTVSDGNGKYSYQYQLSSLDYLGVFSTVVNADLGGRSAAQTAKFVFQKWGVKETPPLDATSGEYIFPLVP
ncbi:MAG TPA: hypothetical protein VMQ44_00725 [Candidatus Saccharimonadales bacterium]|nr:hypothetical protein [Candidatus Saccharimonadales bacterium]